LQESEAHPDFKQMADHSKHMLDQANAQITKLSEANEGYEKKIAELESQLKMVNMEYFDLETKATAKVVELTEERDSENARRQELDHQLIQSQAKIENIMEIGTPLEGDSLQQAQDISTLRARLDAEVNANLQLKTDLGLQERKVTELENRIHAEQKANHEMWNDRNFREQEVLNLKAKLSDLEQAKIDFTQANTDLETAKKSLKKTTCDLKQANTTLETEKKSIEKKLEIVEFTNSNNSAAIVTFANSNNEASDVSSGNSSSEPPIVAYPPSDVDNQRVNKLLTAISKHEDTIWTLQNSISYLRTSRQGQFVQELQENNKAMEFEISELNHLTTELSERAERGEDVAKKFALYKENEMRPTLLRCNFSEKVSNKLSLQIKKLSNEVEVQKDQLKRLRSSNEILKSQLKDREAKVVKQPALTQATVTCIYSSVPSPSDGDDSTVPAKLFSCQTETEEKKKPRHRGQRGGAEKRKKTPDQSVIVASGDLNTTNANVTPENSNNEKEALEEQIIPAGPDIKVTVVNSNITKDNVGPAISNIEGDDLDLLHVKRQLESGWFCIAMCVWLVFCCKITI
jgi:DNA repair exonuclease SbcCD ATPase subunit